MLYSLVDDYAFLGLTNLTGVAQANFLILQIYQSNRPRLQGLEAPFSWLNGCSNELRHLTQILKTTFLPIKRAV